MTQEQIKPGRPNYFVSTLDNRCPRCRTGKIFTSSNPYDLKNTVKMHPQCPVCGQPTEIEVGFYYGTGYVSYALTVAFSVTTLLLWWIIIGLSTEDNRFFWWLGTNSVMMLVLQPFLMRLSRSLWLSWFVSYDPDWRTKKIESLDRVIPGQMEK
jgi:uncharacterized protein (DUF983 family)